MGPGLRVIGFLCGCPTSFWGSDFFAQSCPIGLKIATVYHGSFLKLRSMASSLAFLSMLCRLHLYFVYLLPGSFCALAILGAGAFAAQQPDRNSRQL